MKIKALKSFNSALGNYEKGKQYTVNHDDHVINNWTKNGLIEKVKVTKKSVKTNEAE